LHVRVGCETDFTSLLPSPIRLFCSIRGTQAFTLLLLQAPSDPGTARGRVVSTTRNPHRPGEQLQSATSILLTRELNYGMGPSKHNYSFNYTMKSIRYKLIATPAVMVYGMV
jgi:hypothetical protein